MVIAYLPASTKHRFTAKVGKNIFIEKITMLEVDSKFEMVPMYCCTCPRGIAQWIKHSPANHGGGELETVDFLSSSVLCKGHSNPFSSDKLNS